MRWESALGNRRSHSRTSCRRNPVQISCGWKAIGIRWTAATPRVDREQSARGYVSPSLRSDVFWLIFDGRIEPTVAEPEHLLTEGRVEYRLQPEGASPRAHGQTDVASVC